VVTDPEPSVDRVRRLSDDEFHNLAETVRQVQIERAIGNGDDDAIIGAAFESGFGRDGLGVLPWVEGNTIVCPGGLVAKSESNHRCRFVSVDDVWVWDSGLLLREDKRSSPGKDEGFRAVALIPLVDGTELDVVAGRARGGQHSVEHVVSYEVRSGDLVEVQPAHADRIARPLTASHPPQRWWCCGPPGVRPVSAGRSGSRCTGRRASTR
jgi:hypothetical protein